MLALTWISTGGNKGFNHSYKGAHFPKSWGLTGFGNIELRLGYTFSPENWLVTPFLGLGGYSFGYGNCYPHFEAESSYLTGGFYSQYPVSPTFNIRLNLKIFGSIYAIEKFKFRRVKHSTHNGLWGVGVPFIWLVGSTHRWDIRPWALFFKTQLLRCPEYLRNSFDLWVSILNMLQEGDLSKSFSEWVTPYLSFT